MNELENIIIALLFECAKQRAGMSNQELTMPALAIAARRIKEIAA